MTKRRSVPQVGETFRLGDDSMEWTCSAWGLIDGEPYLWATTREGDVAMFPRVMFRRFAEEVMP